MDSEPKQYTYPITELPEPVSKTYFEDQSFTDEAHYVESAGSIMRRVEEHVGRLSYEQLLAIEWVVSNKKGEPDCSGFPSGREQHYKAKAALNRLRRLRESGRCT